MKKILMVLAAVAATAPLWADTSADVLVWYVDTKTDNASYDGATRAFDTIKFWAVDSNGRVSDLTGLTYTGPDYLLDGGPSAGSGESISVPSAAAPTTSYGSYYTDLRGFDDSYQFFAELYLTGQADPVDRMLSALTWGQFSDYMISSSGLVNDLSLEPSKGLYNMASTMVPEPTSGLLLLVGGALLALRRRRWVG